MNKIKWYHYLLFVVFLLFILLEITDFYANKFHQNIKSNPKKYCYNPKSGNYIWVIQDLDYSKEFITYFSNDNIYDKKVKFEVELIPNNSEVYFLGYKNNSELAKIVCYYFKGGFGQVVEGYIYSDFLYDKPVNDIVNPNGNEVMPIDY